MPAQSLVIPETSALVSQPGITGKPQGNPVWGIFSFSGTPKFPTWAAQAAANFPGKLPGWEHVTKLFSGLTTSYLMHIKKNYLMSIPLYRNRAHKQISPKQIIGWPSVKCTSPGEKNKSLKSRICCYCFLAEIPPTRAAPKVVVQKHSKHSWISIVIHAMVPGSLPTMTVLAWISGLQLGTPEKKKKKSARLAICNRHNLLWTATESYSV